MARTVFRRKPSRAPARGFAEDARPFEHDEIVGGIAPRRVQTLITQGVLTTKQVYRIIPERTFKRRLAKGEALKPAEADAISRLLRVTETAKRMLGDSEFARKWLMLPNPALKNRIPIELAETDSGAWEVEAALSRFAHGDYI